MDFRLISASNVSLLRNGKSASIARDLEFCRARLIAQMFFLPVRNAARDGPLRIRTRGKRAKMPEDRDNKRNQRENSEWPNQDRGSCSTKDKVKSKKFPIEEKQQQQQVIRKNRLRLRGAPLHLAIVSGSVSSSKRASRRAIRVQTNSRESASLIA